jgi:hypothetical protein
MQDRVLADNPLEDETELPLGEIVPAEWRVVVLEHTDPNGTRHIIERGMPLDEIEADFNVAIASQQNGAIEAERDPSATTELNDPRASLSDASVDLTGASRGVAATLQTSPLAVGSTIFVDLPEHGISADFTVREIRPCPTPIAGDGYLVTTKFIHENAKILDLRIEGSDEPIGTTASHPFWSEDRQQFVAAGELRVGENLLLADDTSRRTESITLRPTRDTVYNIEVDGEHVFYVGGDGVLVHNTCDWRMWEKQAGKYFRRQGFDVVGSIRNASGHGIDMVLRNRKTGHIFVAEIKARTRRWGGLSAHQSQGAAANARRILTDLQNGKGSWAPHNVLPGSQHAADVLEAALDPYNANVIFGGGYVLRINELMRGIRKTTW